MRIAAGLAGLWLPLVALAAEWRSNAEDSRLTFTATYERAPALGVLRRFEVRFTFDPARPEQGRLHVTVDVTSADMDSHDLNEAIRTPQWFDTARFPHAEFESRLLRRTDTPGRYLAQGRLRLKGVVRDIEVPFLWRDSGGGSALMEGALTLDRRDFGIGSGEWAEDATIGFDVKVEFRVKLHRQK